MSTLVPCSGCQRHVKSDETTCLFCQAAVAPGQCTGRCARPSTSRLAGAALVAAGAALLGAACESSQSAFPPYGISPHFDAGTPADSTGGQTVDASGKTDAAPDALPDAKK
jgi:hypothetical protein